MAFPLNKDFSFFRSEFLTGLSSLLLSMELELNTNEEKHLLKL